MDRPRLAEVLGDRRRQGRGSVLAYLMVDAARSAAMRSLARAARDAGVAGLELGFPFSDPIADGPVLQAAAARALAHRTGWSDLLQALSTASEELPTAVMTYANPVYRRGLGRAFREIQRCGGSAIILPDVPYEESGPWQRAAASVGLSFVQMASPATSTRRVARLARASSGFLYLVSRFGTTGRGSLSPPAALRSRVRASHRARPDLPVLVGFGVRNVGDLAPVLRSGADGVIVGTAVEERLARGPEARGLERFLTSIARATASGRRVPRARRRS